MQIEAFIQARMGSTRLPGKVLKHVMGKPLLGYLMERLSQSHEISERIVVISDQPSDDVIAEFCEQNHYLYFRGSENDVLDRYYQAALWRNRPQGIVRITADCPLIDPAILDQVVRTFGKENFQFDYVSNCLERTYPRGLDVEVFTFQALEQAALKSTKTEEREHVTPYLYRHPELFKLKNLSLLPSKANHRWTVDTPEDFRLVQLIIEHLYPKNPAFRMQDVLNLFEQHPSWMQINAHIEQKKLPPFDT